MFHLVKRITPILVALACCFTTIHSTYGADDIDVQEEQAIKAAVAHVAPSVVRIETIGGLEKVGKFLVGDGPTTGLVVAADGYILSSAFNFVQKPNTILVTLPGGKKVAAKIVARDHARMLVLLKVKTDKKLPVPEIVPRDKLAVGQWAMAVGRTFQGANTNLSVGIISAKNRVWGRAVQTDAKISPANYGGPLIDIRGRVIGLLVPLSPQGKGQVLAGAEWYDSGIGFAVPLNEVLSHLSTMKRGQDLHPGIFGVSLKKGSAIAAPVIIAACQPNSPAAKAGFKVGDQIVEVDGAKIRRFWELQHALGGKYDGDTIRVVILRGKDKKKMTLVAKLTSKLTAFKHPFLGVLPMRDIPNTQGVVVRFVYPKSPAAKAGIVAGDILTTLNKKPIKDAAAMQDMIVAVDPKQPVSLTFTREGKAKTVKLTLGVLPNDVPATLPPACKKSEKTDAKRPPVGLVNIKLPEARKDSIAAYVPENYDPAASYGVVLWLHPAGKWNQDQLIAAWKPLCEKHHLILLMPKAASVRGWQRTEVGFVRKALDALISDYHIDSTRIVAHGHLAGAAMAYLVGFNHRDLIRGIAVNGAIPGRLRCPANAPVHRLAFYITRAKKAANAPRIAISIKQLQKMAYPVTVHETEGTAGPMDDKERAELARWIDTLDRI